MSSDQNILSNTSYSRDENAIVIPCSTEDFAGFISSLIGKGQSVTRVINGPFEVNRNFISNIHELIEQRVSAQNQGSLLSFEAIINFDDSSTLILNNIQDLMTFNVIKPLASRSIKLSWQYIIQFKAAKAPLKQTIEIIFEGGRVINYTGDMSFRYGMPGGISYSINYSDRSWGNDIDSLLDGHMQACKVDGPFLAKFLNKHSSKVSQAVFAITAIIALAGLGAVTNSVSEGFLAKVNLIPQSNINLENISNSVNTLIDYTVGGFWTKYAIASALYLMVMSVAVIAMAIKVEEISEKVLISHVILTEKSEKIRENYYRGFKNNRFKLLISVIGAIIIGVAGNALFSLLVYLWIPKI